MLWLKRFSPRKRYLSGAILLLASTLAIATPADTGETLDNLMAKRLPADNTFVAMVEARTLRLRGTLDQLPAPGKTIYMTDTLAARRIQPAPKVNHKMWLRSAGGARVMVYVADDVAERIRHEVKTGAEIDVTALYLWNSRHGPGLLVTAFEPVNPWREKAVRWFGGKT